MDKNFEIPLDDNNKPVSVIFAYDPISKSFVPLAATNNGDGTCILKVDASLEVKDIQIGAVEIKDAIGTSRAIVNSDGSIAVRADLNPGTSIISGQTNVTTAGIRVALTGSQDCLSVTIKSKPTNTGYIYVGTAAGVSSLVGFILSAKESVTIDVNNLALVGLDSSVSGEGVSYIALVK